jgi:hypothetical protein
LLVYREKTKGPEEPTFGSFLSFSAANAANSGKVFVLPMRAFPTQVALAFEVGAPMRAARFL